VGDLFKMKRSILRECIRIARAKNFPGNHPCWNSFKHYSFVIQNNKIIEIGMNRKIKPPVWLGYHNLSGRHAEVDVYQKAKGIIDPSKSFEVVNIRLNKRGELRDSAPCKFCSKFLQYVGCQTVYFSMSTGGIAKTII
jgi:hypothetical protein